MVAQDVGSAIKGPIRGICSGHWRTGAGICRAHEEQRRYYLLLPKACGA